MAGVTVLDTVGLDEPTSLFATTANVYAVPFVSPVTSIVVVPPDTVVVSEEGATRSPGVAVTV